MPAAAAATVTAAQMVICLKYQQPTNIEVKVPGQDSFRLGLRALTPKGVDALLADARPIAEVLRDPSQQCVWNLRPAAPAIAFVRCAGAELAIVWAMTQRAFTGILWFRPHFNSMVWITKDLHNESLHRENRANDHRHSNANDPFPSHAIMLTHCAFDLEFFYLRFFCAGLLEYFLRHRRKRKQASRTPDASRVSREVGFGSFLERVPLSLCYGREEQPARPRAEGRPHRSVLRRSSAEGDSIL
jgi:hypothetical protein